ncbi:MAG: hypothetical protein B6242_10450 [Anaerolineaceae bacterium 4572_78]|nr:MAG: hypothetical protein B6242_10450 [Anaerolineaceae bacterium 4572_78]
MNRIVIIIIISLILMTGCQSEAQLTLAPVPSETASFRLSTTPSTNMVAPSTTRGEEVDDPTPTAPSPTREGAENFSTPSPFVRLASVDGKQFNIPESALSQITNDTIPMPIPLPTPGPLFRRYKIQDGDTLGWISWKFDMPINEILAMNNLREDDIINVGKTLILPLHVSNVLTTNITMPDSEVVYSPTYIDFDIEAFLHEQGGYLAHYEERVENVNLSGAEIIELIAKRYSVGPRILLTALEFYGQWVTNPQPKIQQLGAGNPFSDRLYVQLAWMSNKINDGYYSYKREGNYVVEFRDGTLALISPGINAGTVGIQNLLAQNINWSDLQVLHPQGTKSLEGKWGMPQFLAQYEEFFGDMHANKIYPLIPITLEQPTFSLPWEKGEMFYFTGGPHVAYGIASVWSAIDFGPSDVLGSCYISQKHITAVAPGLILFNGAGEIYLDLDGDGNWQTGSHLHFARRYNGEWIAADGPVPLNLSGWQTKNGLAAYEGTLFKGDIIKEACQCWDDEKNGIIHEK